MAKPIPIKSNLDECDYAVFRRYQKFFGQTEAEFIRRALNYFYVEHEGRLETHERLRTRSALGFSSGGDGPIPATT